jgi:hypothetical protein
VAASCHGNRTEGRVSAETRRAGLLELVTAWLVCSGTWRGAGHRGCSAGRAGGEGHAVHQDVQVGLVAGHCVQRGQVGGREPKSSRRRKQDRAKAADKQAETRRFRARAARIRATGGCRSADAGRGSRRPRCASGRPGCAFVDRLDLRRCRGARCRERGGGAAPHRPGARRRGGDGRPGHWPASCCPPANTRSSGTPSNRPPATCTTVRSGQWFISHESLVTFLPSPAPARRGPKWGLWHTGPARRGQGHTHPARGAQSALQDLRARVLAGFAGGASISFTVMSGPEVSTIWTRFGSRVRNARKLRHP